MERIDSDPKEKSGSQEECSQKLNETPVEKQQLQKESQKQDILDNQQITQQQQSGDKAEKSEKQEKNEQQETSEKQEISCQQEKNEKQENKEEQSEIEKQQMMKKEDVDAKQEKQQENEKINLQEKEKNLKQLQSQIAENALLQVSEKKQEQESKQEKVNQCEKLNDQQKEIIQPQLQEIQVQANEKASSSSKENIQLTQISKDKIQPDEKVITQPNQISKLDLNEQNKTITNDQIKDKSTIVQELKQEKNINLPTQDLNQFKSLSQPTKANEEETKSVLLNGKMKEETIIQLSTNTLVPNKQNCEDSKCQEIDPKVQEMKGELQSILNKYILSSNSGLQYPNELPRDEFFDFYRYMYEYTQVQKYDAANMVLSILKSMPNFANYQPNQFQVDIAEDIQQVMKDLKFLEDNLKDTTGWESEKFANKTIIQYKQLKSEQTISLRIESELDIPIFNLCAMIYEIELYKKWVPFCDQTYTIKRVKRADKLAYLKATLPIISDRDAYVDGAGIDRLDFNGTLIIACKSIHYNKKVLQKHHIVIPKNNNVRFDINYFFCEIVVVNEKKITFKSICNLNPNVNFLPRFCVNYFIKKIGSYMLQKMLKLSQNIKGTEWEKAMQKPENRDFYEWVDQRLKEHFKSQKNAQLTQQHSNSQQAKF